MLGICLATIEVCAFGAATSVAAFFIVLRGGNFMALHFCRKTSPDYRIIFLNFVSLFGNINWTKKMWIGLLYKTIYIL